jgi:hypothetical protein
MHYTYYNAKQKPEIHRTGARSWRKPDSLCSARHGRSLHYIMHELQIETYQRHNKWKQYSLLVQIGMTAMIESSEERPLQTEDRLQHAVHRSTVLRRVQNDPRLADAPSALKTHRTCNVSILTTAEREDICHLQLTCKSGTPRTRS